VTVRTKPTKRGVTRFGALLLALGCALPPAAGHHDTKPTQKEDGFPALVILVRHAEKAAEPKEDPPLSPAGLERAQALAETLEHAGVTAIVVSHRLRTRQTAEPLARARGLTPVVVGPAPPSGGPTHAEAVAAEVRRHPGEVVLVVGHSDTIPAIIAALGGPRLPDIPDAEYSGLYTLVPGPEGPRLVRSRYGAGDRREAAAPAPAGSR
jgi:phosphohistidine phosphatase SixA